MNTVKIDPSWSAVLKDEFKKDYWKDLTSFVKQQYASANVCPAPAHIFRAFDLCPFESVKVVIVGQDPYHGKGQANGLSFAVNEGVALPPSLKNIFLEIQKDTVINPVQSGDLTRWATQGVLMLNSVLTVGLGQPASHSKKGWEQFTDAVIKALNVKRSHIVYMLWGKYAQTKGQIIDRKRNLVLSSGHPSPYSSHLFFGNHHFSLCNEYLVKNGLEPIDWR